MGQTKGTNVFRVGNKVKYTPEKIWPKIDIAPNNLDKNFVRGDVYIIKNIIPCSTPCPQHGCVGRMQIGEADPDCYGYKNGLPFTLIDKFNEHKERMLRGTV